MYNTESESSSYSRVKHYKPFLNHIPFITRCGATQANVTRDIQLLSQLTTRIRLYGANCNQTALVLQAIQDTKVDMSVYVAICKCFIRSNG
jgi:exo-beta-1,3-glucanase (GH17 family)